MNVLAIDLGGTKLSFAVFDMEGALLHTQKVLLEGRYGEDVGQLIIAETASILTQWNSIAIGICVPGIYDMGTGRVWAPNIPGWEDYPLLRTMQEVASGRPVAIDSDRACYVLGESWKGAAQGCRDAIFLAVGTGIGAGILVDGRVLHGHHGIAGAIGWMALEAPFRDDFKACGCFESQASGNGIAAAYQQAKALRVTAKPVNADRGDDQLNETGGNRSYVSEEVNTVDTGDDKLDKARGKANGKHLGGAEAVFAAMQAGDEVADKVIRRAIERWGMSVANLVSVFDTEKIIFGGGVFGPAAAYIPDIRAEAERWAQPISMRKVVLEKSWLEDKAGLYGAAKLAWKHVKYEH